MITGIITLGSNYYLCKFKMFIHSTFMSHVGEGNCYLSIHYHYYDYKKPTSPFVNYFLFVK